MSDTEPAASGDSASKPAKTGESEAVKLAETKQNSVPIAENNTPADDALNATRAIIAQGIAGNGEERQDEAHNGSKDSINLDATDNVYYSRTCKNKRLLDELIKSGVKCNQDEIVFIIRIPSGSLLWLEKGNDSAGLEHIKSHTEFIKIGILLEDIQNVLIKVLLTDPSSVIKTPKGYTAEYVYNSRRYKVAYGTNGFIVSFFPCGHSKMSIT